MRGLDNQSSDVFHRSFHILERVTIVESFLLLLDFVEDGLVEQLFSSLLNAVQCVSVSTIFFIFKLSLTVFHLSVFSGRIQRIK